MIFSKTIDIGGVKIGSRFPVFVVAEVGVAHFGRYDDAIRLIDIAYRSGADAVKFQIYKTENLICSGNTEWYNRYKKKELTYHQFQNINSYCKKKGIMFFASAHDDESFDFLKRHIKPPVYKIGSGEIGNFGYIQRVAATQKPVFLSLGMYRLEDITVALRIFKEANNPNVVALHCTTQYPTPPGDAQLLRVKVLNSVYRVISGYSDHTEGAWASCAAVALGASVIEKHISIHFNVPDSHDWKCSCGKDNFDEFVRDIKNTAKATRSDFRIDPVRSEWATKCCVAKRNILLGETVSCDMITPKRPMAGIPIDEIDKLIGKTITRKVLKDRPITWESVSA